MSKRLQYLQELSESSPNDAFVLFALAKEYEGLQDTSQALHFYLRLKASDPSYIGLYYHLGKLYETMEVRNNALTVYAEGIAIAQIAGDLHALSELKGAKLNLELGLD